MHNLLQVETHTEGTVGDGKQPALFRVFSILVVYYVHNILLDKLFQLNMDPAVLKWFQNYLYCF